MKHPMFDKVNAQLKEFMRELTVDIPRQLHHALSMGDLSENAEYEMTKQRQLFVESRIKQLEELMGSLKNLNLEALPRDRIAYGSRIVAEDLNSGERKQYLIVFPGENPAHKTDQDILVTLASPIAQALLGKAQGDEVVVRLPKGTFEWCILEFTPFQELMSRESQLVNRRISGDSPD
ncbi:GreA/GreB family elongation factor [bacterium]|nr:GreA/GreB family elongation factor [candidate division CSSED10-310 bacterium]